jgi:hypothetical protein
MSFSVEQRVECNTEFPFVPTVSYSELQASLARTETRTSNPQSVQ